MTPALLLLLDLRPRLRLDRFDLPSHELRRTLRAPVEVLRHRVERRHLDGPHVVDTEIFSHRRYQPRHAAVRRCAADRRRLPRHGQHLHRGVRVLSRDQHRQARPDEQLTGPSVCLLPASIVLVRIPVAPGGVGGEADGRHGRRALQRLVVRHQAAACRVLDEHERDTRRPPRPGRVVRPLLREDLLQRLPVPLAHVRCLETVLCDHLWPRRIRGRFTVRQHLLQNRHHVDLHCFRRGHWLRRLLLLLRGRLLRGRLLRGWLPRRHRSCRRYRRCHTGRHPHRSRNRGRRDPQRWRTRRLLLRPLFRVDRHRGLGRRRPRGMGRTRCASTGVAVVAADVVEPSGDCIRPRHAVSFVVHPAVLLLVVLLAGVVEAVQLALRRVDDDAAVAPASAAAVLRLRPALADDDHGRHRPSHPFTRTVAVLQPPDPRLQHVVGVQDRLELSVHELLLRAGMQDRDVARREEGDGEDGHEGLVEPAASAQLGDGHGLPHGGKGRGRGGGQDLATRLRDCTRQGGRGRGGGCGGGSAASRVLGEHQSGEIILK